MVVEGAGAPSLAVDGVRVDVDEDIGTDLVCPGGDIASLGVRSIRDGVDTMLSEDLRSNLGHGLGQLLLVLDSGDSSDRILLSGVTNSYLHVNLPISNTELDWGYGEFY